MSLALFVGGAFCLCSLPQSTGHSSAKDSTQLKVRIIPTKREFTVREKVFVQWELVNLTDETLCLPEPDMKCSDAKTGSLILESDDPGKLEREQFICHLCGGSWGPPGKLLSSIRDDWIKIAPRGVYLSNSAEAQVTLDIPGEWRLRGSYRPPEASFGDPMEFRRYLDSAAKMVGCVVPSGRISAESVTLNVASKPGGN